METQLSTRTGVKYRRDLRSLRRISPWTLLHTILTVLSKHAVDFLKIMILLSIHHLPETAFFRPQEKCYHATILHSRSLKKCHKKFEKRLTNKNFKPENLNRAFSIVKMLAREVTIFPEKI